MNRTLALLAVALLGGCGDNLEVPVGADPVPGDLLGRLRALPGVTAVETPTDTTGFQYIVLQFTQPVDHEDPDGPKFQQEVSLLHRDLGAPMIVQTSGYWDYYLDSPVELTRLLSANQISIEHRFFGSSRPEPADWSKLTIRQMADDQHAIIEALRTIYDGAFVTTGGSKGGMTAVYHRRFYPDDVDGTVPYVAPLSFGAPDLRYSAFVDTLGPAACRQAVRGVAIELLSNRRAMVESRTTDQAQTEGHDYTRIPLAPAVESSILSLEWAFWQYYGVGLCPQVPVASASDEVLWSFLDQVSPPSDNDDAQVSAFDAYYYQAYGQLGYPDSATSYLDQYLQFSDADYAGSLPTAIPPYDGGAAMRDIDQWVKAEGDRLLFVYGEWDPWTGGQFELGQATDSLRLVQAKGSHSSRIGRLAADDEAAAHAKLAAWTGVTPSVVQQQRSRSSEDDRREPRVPPAIVRAMRGR
ncbi:MAG: putative secreted tripeptidyl aminopeptidase [Myxococcales bacterium]|nr:putative secreted tripeptidyl aminopeptidase [Myxococcales bacterium]